ncbi:hypothetical protein JVT61DRAFT_10276 [Boletus reticuloceps]|uniref:Protein kinase domain-containing protein n=1 Tax=Boletus reticuloceps TaxID=495285 RepID=A0A8I3ABY9_9AGAM|nr:hypothetical protein JVT61DRAFT_10276 [Boletus reticuloceps]
MSIFQQRGPSRALKELSRPSNLSRCVMLAASDLKLYAILSPKDEDLEDTHSRWTFDGKLHISSRQKVLKLLGSFVIVRAPDLLAAQFSLNCWLHGEATHMIFPVEVSRTKNLGALRQAIKAERFVTFGNIDAANIRLHHVLNCSSEDLEETAKGIDFEKPLLGIPLLSGIFSEPLVSNRVHVIVGCPSPDDRTMPIQVGEQDNVLASLAETFNRITMNDGPTPSVAAKLHEYAKIQSGSQSILDCRCPARKPVNTVAPPIQLFHPAFDPAYAIPDNFVRDVRDLMARFTLIYDGENTRRKEIGPVLSKAIGRFLGSITNSDKTSLDFVVQSSHGELPTYLIIDEEKNEFGDGGSDPSVQASFSFLRLFCQPEVMTSQVFPLSLLAEALLPIHSTHDDGQCHRIARILYALRESIQRLDSWYKGLNVAPFDLSPTFHFRFWPSPDSYRDSDTNTLVKFTYQKPLERDVSCVTYLAQTLEDNSKDIVVKFVTGTSYGADAHRHMASKGFAPRLLYYGGINVTPEMPSYGDLRMVVMERVKGWTLHEVLERKSEKTLIPSSFKSDLEHAFTHLHGAGYVFGDLRKPNVMVLPEGTPGSAAQLIDFDWAGE